MFVSEMSEASDPDHQVELYKLATTRTSAELLKGSVSLIRTLKILRIQ